MIGPHRLNSSTGETNLHLHPHNPIQTTTILKIPKFETLKSPTPQSHRPWPQLTTLTGDPKLKMKYRRQSVQR